MRRPDRMARAARRSTASSPTGPCGRLAARIPCSTPGEVRRPGRCPVRQTVMPVPWTSILLGNHLRLLRQGDQIPSTRWNRDCTTLMSGRSDTGWTAVGCTRRRQPNTKILELMTFPADSLDPKVTAIRMGQGSDPGGTRAPSRASTSAVIYVPHASVRTLDNCRPRTRSSLRTRPRTPGPQGRGQVLELGQQFSYTIPLSIASRPSGEGSGRG
jgi:hypothetical protein